MLKIGDQVPNVTSLNQNNEAVKLSDYQGHKNIVLYFYPKDDTPGCTIEANDFTKLAAEFAAANTVVIGVSKDDCGSHQAFIDKFGLKVDLLADTSGEVCDAFGVWQLKEKNGVSKMGIVRSTFIINKQGTLTYVEYGVSPDGHAAQMLELVKEL
ncbi:peroxiredoxin [Thiomicrorhabdus sp.]|uniref:peroxiredoxin n=1 Tax=Thiomicrorhabdus sp. TaxID=2039724 RepID=UPI002AA7B838|nr:peroxiredoxin [Thiomicrorhabdus sp.]